MHEDKNENIVVRHSYATLITEGSSDTRYIATCAGENQDGTYKIIIIINNHLMRVEAGINLKWKLKRDLLNLHLSSIFDCKIDGNGMFLTKYRLLFTEKSYPNIIIRTIFQRQLKEMFNV